MREEEEEVEPSNACFRGLGVPVAVEGVLGGGGAG